MHICPVHVIARLFLLEQYVYEMIVVSECCVLLNSILYLNAIVDYLYGIFLLYHDENTPIQIYRKFHLQKN